MRVPPSAIVMGVVAAVPFGLGIRDALRHEPEVRLERHDGVLGGERDRARAAYEAELALEQAKREARAARQIAQLDQLFGTSPATMGSLFEGIQLGDATGDFQPAQVRDRIEHAMRDGFLTITLDGTASALDAVRIDIHTDGGTSDACDQLDAKLVAAWGHSVAGVWIDPAAHQRATLVNGSSCRLQFERYLEPAELVAQLPFAAIGRPADKLVEQLGDRAGVVEDGILWALPGVGAGKGVTSIEAFVTEGRVVGFTLRSNADFESLIAIRDALSAKLEAKPAQTTDDTYEGQIWAWAKGRVPVTIRDDARGSFTITAGKQPWD